MTATDLQQKLNLAANVLLNTIHRKTVQHEEQLKIALELKSQSGDAAYRAEKLLETLQKFSAAPDLQAQIGALNSVREFLKTLESNPAAELTYEFYIGKLEDYQDNGDLSQPIDENKLKGRTGAFMQTLRMLDIDLVWQPRMNAAKASFVIKGN